MADNPQTLALIVVAQNYRGNVVRQINRKAALLKLLQIKQGAGKNCAWAPEADGQLAENYADGADVADYGSDAQDSAILPWGLYRSNFRLTGLAAAAGASSGTPQGNVSLWARNMVNSSGKLASTINAALYNGAGTGTTIAGLGVAIGDATNTYATINRATSPANVYWRPIVTDPGSPTLPTFASIRKHLGLIYDACGEVPDIAMCPTSIFNTIGSLFDPTRRYIKEIETAKGVIKLDAGYEGLEMDGCVFFKDKDATAAQIQFINTNHLWIEFLPPDVPGLAEVLKQMVPANDGFGQIPLGFTYEKLAKTGDSDKAMVKSYLQQVCDRPNSCGVMKNVASVT